MYIYLKNYNVLIDHNIITLKIHNFKRAGAKIFAEIQLTTNKYISIKVRVKISFILFYF